MKLLILLLALFSGLAASAEKPLYQPLADWRSDVFYALVIDRFYDGDKANNPRVKQDLFGFKGGDIQGIIDKLDYLKNLGVTAIILSPITDSPAYHGYHPTDLFKMNPRFGDLPTFRRLIKSAHAKGLKIIFDLVLNHAAKTSPLVTEHPDWFRKPATFAASNEYNFSKIKSQVTFLGLPDFDHSLESVFEYQKKAAWFWIDQGVDGFRMDAVNQIEPAYWAKFNSAVKNYAGNDFLILGELYEDLTDVINEYADYFDMIYDFQYYFTLQDVLLRDGSLHQLYFSEEIAKNYSNKNLLLSAFADNHDVSRFRSSFTKQSPDLSFETGQNRFRQALALIFTRPGPPYLLYGSEVFLPDADILSSTTYDTARNQMFFRDNEKQKLYRFIKNLAAIRKKFGLADAEKLPVSRTNLSKFYCEGFVSKKGKVIFVYNIHNSQSVSDKLSLRPFKEFSANGRLIDLQDNSVLNYKNYLLNLTVPAYGVKILQVTE